METKVKAAGSGKRKVNVVAVISDIEEEILASGLPFSAWVCGITHDPVPSRITGDLKPVIGTLRCWDVGSELDARQIEIILRRNGCQASPYPGDRDAHYIFVFLPQEEAAN